MLNSSQIKQAFLTIVSYLNTAFSKPQNQTFLKMTTIIFIHFRSIPIYADNEHFPLFSAVLKHPAHPYLKYRQTGCIISMQSSLHSILYYSAVSTVSYSEVLSRLTSLVSSSSMTFSTFAAIFSSSVLKRSSTRFMTVFMY